MLEKSRAVVLQYVCFCHVLHKNKFKFLGVNFRMFCTLVYIDLSNYGCLCIVCFSLSSKAHFGFPKALYMFPSSSSSSSSSSIFVLVWF